MNSILDYMPPVEIRSLTVAGLEYTLEEMLRNPIMDESEVKENE